MSFIISLLGLLFRALALAIFIRAVMSWVSPGQTNMPTSLLYQVTEPILAPLRRIIPRMGMMDLSPLAAIIILQVLAAVFSRF
ncbi:YggT family protein [Chloroflexota bacterium]